MNNLFLKACKKIARACVVICGGVLWYCTDLIAYIRMRRVVGQNTAPLYFFPKIFDRNPMAHTFDKHYVYMDMWAFTHLERRRPEHHVDIGSSIRFLSMASVVTPLVYVDIRPVQLDFANLTFQAGSILSLPFPDNSLSSISCLHVAEHIGLGRYGDPLDPAGTAKACAELRRVLAPGGVLYFALPIGVEAVYFNAHRVHQPQTILDYFSGLQLVEFAAINDGGHFIRSAKVEDYTNARYACGCFYFTKV